MLVMPAAALSLLLSGGTAAGSPPWWERAVFYEIYPRSFQDTNGDGIGDLNGITARLDYLADLGVDALWLTPFYPSPQVDFGYDVADYENVDPRFGTLADFDRLVAEAHKRGLRIVTDLVLNHTSAEHPFFVESRSSRASAKRDWYVWRDPKPGGGPPNNWYSAFGPSAWTLDARTGQYYYHFFYAEQPDLNWRNPEVEAAIFAAARFWLERGVDGFRLDAVNWLFEDPQLRDNPVLPKLRQGSATEHQQDLRYNRDLPDTHPVLQRLRALCDGYGGDRVLIGEIWAPTIEQLVEYYGPARNEVQLPFNFFFLEVPRLDAALFRAEVAKAEAVLAGRATTWVLSNHDRPRARDRYGDGTNDDRIATLLATMLLTLRGSPFVYYGEEIGMPTTPPRTIDEVRDPVGRRYWPQEKGRDGERTPMQWDATANAGFTTGAPWLPVPEAAAVRNVAVQSGDSGSVLTFYRRLLRLRRASPALVLGDYGALGADPQVFAYRRRSPGQTLVVALNMSPGARVLSMSEAEAGGRALRVAASNVREGGAVVRPGAVSLAPYEAVVLEPLPQ